MFRTFWLLTLMSVPGVVTAQTWARGRETPTLREIVLVDATGEDAWPFGAEDIAGDGLATFDAAEASVDVRSTYAAADAQGLWVRLYVSSEDPAGQHVQAFVFMDVDADRATGGGADAPEIHPRFVEDDSGGGYERVLAFRGTEEVLGVWSWDGAGWIPEDLGQDAPVVETGVDRDPLLFGLDEHGYLQAFVEHGVTGLDAGCDASLLVRTWNEDPVADYGDLEVGERADCVAEDVDDSGAPDVLEGYACDADDDCAGEGVCVDGDCLAGNACLSDLDCAGDEACSGGRCWPVATGACVSSADCGDLVCDNGECVACSSPGEACDATRVCSPTGRCISGQVGGGGGGDGFDLDDGEVQGGACACRAGAGANGAAGLLLLVGSLAALVLRRRARRGSGGDR